MFSLGSGNTNQFVGAHTHTYMSGYGGVESSSRPVDKLIRREGVCISCFSGNHAEGPGGELRAMRLVVLSGSIGPLPPLVIFGRR
nr:hypothetical protein CFP56_72665 [Quercus suber]